MYNTYCGMGCIWNGRNAGETVSSRMKGQRGDEKKKINHCKVCGSQHLTCTNNILKCFKYSRSTSHATTVEWQKNQKGSKFSPVSHLPCLSLWLWWTGFSKICGAHKNLQMFHL